MTGETRETISLKFYKAASRATEPIAAYALKKRLRAGKESVDRIAERRGIASLPRPDGELIWVHGASVGESLSVIPLVERLTAERPAANILVTTGTVTSAELLAKRLPERSFHQFVPLDHPDFIESFLQHWRPSSALLVESEFWPNLILQTRKAVSFMALINGRVSPKSFSDWRTHPNSIKYLLSSFDTIIGQDSQNAERLSHLAGRPVEMFGNLKIAAAPLSVDPDELDEFKQCMNGRPCWLAASTHPGEEEIAIAVHQEIRRSTPGLITFIAPRHPARGIEVAAIAKSEGLAVVRRAAGEPIDSETDIYVADTLGELGLFYRLCDISFIGGSITPKGGHNPLEPARLHTAILNGPETFNFTETYQHLKQAGGAALVRNNRELAAAIHRLFADGATKDSMADAAQNVAAGDAQKVLNCVTGAILSGMNASQAS